MRLVIVVEAGRTRAWIRRLAERLGRAGAEVRVESVAPIATPDGDFERLMRLERLVNGARRPPSVEPIAVAAIAPTPEPGFIAEVTLDLTALPQVQASGRTLAVAWDGGWGEDAALAALLTGTTPLCEVVDVATGEVLERGLASLEAASGIGGALDAITARLATVLDARISAWSRGRDRGAPPPIARAAPGRAPSFGRRAAKMIAASVARRLYRATCHTPHWRIGWRHIDGPGLGDTGDFAGPTFRVLPDPGARFYADPFPWTREGRTVVFFEDLAHHTNKGIVAAIAFDERGPVGEAFPVLEEPWHLSYPFLVEHGGELWMIPESMNARDVAIYRCRRYPDRWERAATLIENVALSDVTVFENEGRWWMFATHHDEAGGWSDVLAIHSAPSLFGPWTAHEGNPALVDRATARPAGAVFRRDGRLFRPVQDCSRTYGGAVSIAEITRLDDGGFEQVIRHRLAPGPHWPGRNLHTLNRFGRLEVIDGTVVRPKWPWLAGFVDRACEPRGDAP